MVNQNKLINVCQVKIIRLFFFQDYKLYNTNTVITEQNK